MLKDNIIPICALLLFLPGSFVIVFIKELSEIKLHFYYENYRFVV